MPIYEYRCEQGHQFEVMQRMSDDPVVSCETCSAPVARVFHPIAVHFKGSGFYNTDYGTQKRSREMKESGEGTHKKESGESNGKPSTEKASSSSDSSSSKKSETASPASSSSG